MEKKEVIWQIKAIHSLQRIEHIIAIDKPGTAINFGTKLREFGNSLGDFSNYEPCRYHKIKNRGMFCYPYKKHYVFVFRVTNTTLIIMDIAHTSRLR